jgi:hypothetical protein
MVHILVVQSVIEKWGIIMIRKMIYISCPCRGNNSWETQSHIAIAEYEARCLSDLGFIPICLHTMYKNFIGTLNDDFWKEAARTIMKKCDAVLFTKGWENSGTCIEEERYAEDNNLKVFYKRSDIWTECVAEQVEQKSNEQTTESF